MIPAEKKIRNVIIVCLLFVVLLTASYMYVEAKRINEAKADGVSENCQLCLKGVGIDVDLPLAKKAYLFAIQTRLNAMEIRDACACNCTKFCEVDSWTT